MKEAFQVYYKEKKEPAKVEMLKTIHNLLEMYYKIKLVPYKTNTNKLYEVASKQTFMPVLVQEVVNFLTDYFDNVREQAQLVVLFVCKMFIQENHTLSGQQEQTLHILKANALIGWGTSMSN